LEPHHKLKIFTATVAAATNYSCSVSFRVFSLQFSRLCQLTCHEVTDAGQTVQDNFVKITAIRGAANPATIRKRAPVKDFSRGT